jgi:sialic acid synthase SpsE
MWDAMKRIITIGSRKVGPEQPVFIIAEAGINHGGNMETAKKMIKEAAKCGADAIKFQTYITEKRVDEKSPIYSVLKKCELDEDGLRELFFFAKKNKIIFFSTPFEKESVDLLAALPVPAFKVASFYIVNLGLLEYLAAKGRPIIASTGMANTREISRAVKIFKKHEVDYALLHCVSAYPTKEEDVNLRIMTSLREKFKCVVGYSDHTLGIKTPIYSVALGASILEKHFTLNKNLEGPDHKLSADPEDFRKIVSEIRQLEKILGSGEIRLLDAEKGSLQYRKYG